VVADANANVAAIVNANADPIAIADATKNKLQPNPLKKPSCLKAGWFFVLHITNYLCDCVFAPN